MAGWPGVSTIGQGGTPCGSFTCYSSEAALY